MVLARLITGAGAYSVFDLVPRPPNWGRLCKSCTSAEQRPVYHTKENTKCDPAAKALLLAVAERKQRESLVQPKAERIVGPQVARKRKMVHKEAVSVESKMLVPALKAALSALNVPAREFAGFRKPALVELLLNKRGG